MSNILNKLYYGEINPSEKPAPDTKRYIENRETISDAESMLVQKFPDCIELLNEYTDALRIEAQLESEADFERGFSLGAMLMAEILEIDK